MVFPTYSFRDEVKRLGSSLPSYVRLLQSENICITAARATVRQVLELAEQGIHSLLLSPTQLSLAAVVLALHIVKNPGKRLVRSDLELLITATEHLEAQFRRGGQHPSFIRGFETLRTSVSAATDMEQQHQQGTAPGIRATPNSDVRPGTMTGSRAERDADGNGNFRDSISLLGDQTLLLPDLAPELSILGTSDDTVH